MDFEREQVYLAALLHDIGKFYQRADTGSVAGSKYLKEYSKIESTFLPLSVNGKYSHKHCLWTAQFIEDFQEVFRKLVGADSANLTDKNNLMFLAAAHHLKNEQLSPLGQIIKKADCLSSGMDRNSLEALEDDQDESKWNSFKTKRMVSIFDILNKNKEELKQQKNWHHLPIDALNLSKNYFPRSEFNENPDYEKLWENFLIEFKFIQANTYRAFSETLLNLLFKYTSCISSSTIVFPDVSLYDHSKTTAALAVCLYDYQHGTAASKDPFLLIGGDMSGIQMYIYQIVSKYAGKNLKGRSFYIQILSDAVVRFLLKKLHLFRANIIYDSGGSFYLIAPNTTFVNQQLTDAILFIEQQMFEKHGIQLYMAIDAVTVSEDALMHKGEEHLGDIWNKLFEKRNKKKNNKYLSLITNSYDKLFTPFMQGGLTKRDRISGEEFFPNEKPFYSPEISEEFNEENPIKEITGKQILMGKYLRETDFLVVSEQKIPYWDDKIFIAPIELGFYYYFLKTAEIEKMKERLQASADKITLVTLNGKNGNCDFMGDIKIRGLNNIYELKFYGGNEFNGKTFDKMCDSESLSRLGILRMDVDNLGNIFQTGILPEMSTLSRFSALSRSFDFYFSGYLNMLQQEIAPDSSFIIYSGGDDLFIVGDWRATIELAKKLQVTIKEFSCHNPSLHISGGIAIVEPTFPIMKSAEESQKEEKAAKEHTCKEAVKNSISFMDMPLHWEKEFPTVELLKNTFVEIIKKGSPKSLLGKIMQHTANADIRNHKVHRNKTYWMLTYDLSRMKERNKDHSLLNDLIDNCLKEVCGNVQTSLNGLSITTEYHPLELWAFAARWAELELRS
ncbi:MAG: HD domain protein [Bacteroidetes bacterium ADurb.BinA395]|nr:MAG: HD domain protein [Bacteroidetes bacterium ADurb.BinA395]